MHSENDLWPQDRATLNNLLSNPVSENEKVFFTKLKEKMIGELAPCMEVHFSEKDNPDKIFVLRDQYDEFIIGTDRDDVEEYYIHVQSLTAALSLNLKELGYLDRDITLLEWLRERDYAGAMYDHNNAYL